MIARVFPSKTRATPDDEHAYFDVPGLFDAELGWVRSQWLCSGKTNVGKPTESGEGSQGIGQDPP